MEHTDRYELIFQMSGAEDDVVTVRLTDRTGAATNSSSRCPAPRTTWSPSG
ncbi:DUF6296 family protein [Streptomyces cavourensis]|uniref:DUF6296 family protein n=1 Tax=Streptomyces cavourensis TaxID=67258 RepID=UPI0020CA0714|nr:DUF6296 family protein [Streptomyces cavourensis]